MLFSVIIDIVIQLVFLGFDLTDRLWFRCVSITSLPVVYLRIESFEVPFFNFARRVSKFGCNSLRCVFLVSGDITDCM